MMRQFEKKSAARIALLLLLLVAAVAAMAGLRRFGARTNSRPADTLAVAMQYSPVSFFMDGDTLAGLDLDLLAALGIPYKIYPVATPHQGLDGLRRGTYDLVIADLPLSQELSEDYLFTVPAYLDRQVLVQTADSASRITSVLELIGDTVYVPAGSPAAERMANIAREVGGDITVMPMEQTSEKLVLMQALGQLPGPTVVNEKVARQIMADYPGRLDASMQISFTQFQPWALRPDDTLRVHLLNTRLDSLKSTPRYRALLSRYLD